MTDPEYDEAREAQEQARAAMDQALDAVREHADAAGVAGGAGFAGLLGGMVMGRARRSLRRARPRGRRLRRFGLGILIVVLSVATCSWGVEPATLTAPWGEPVAASTQDAARVLTRGVDAFRAAPESGAVRITVTESEATAALSLGLMVNDLMMAADRIPQEEIQQAADLEALRVRIWDEAEQRRREIAERSGITQRILLKLDPKIRTGNVQVRFEGSGEVVMAGYVQAWAFRLPGLFVFAPSARSGELVLDFVSGRLGRLPLPEFVFDWLGGMVARGVLLGRGYAEVSEIAVRDGALTFAARVSD